MFYFYLNHFYIFRVGNSLKYQLLLLDSYICIRNSRPLVENDDISIHKTTNQVQNLILESYSHISIYNIVINHVNIIHNWTDSALQYLIYCIRWYAVAIKQRFYTRLLPGVPDILAAKIWESKQQVQPWICI